ncbi:MAG TPA: carbon starvation CstA family protein, partial [Candidatus Binatia bacterium]|nr:carbon starvation CstA family protein [Candidatus Binatia bacterium]
YVPTKPFYLLGQHFSAIAAAGPIAGPILAAQMFGWLPCVLWIALGVVFIGAVHDFSALIASVRHKAKSVAEIVRQNLGQRAWVAIMAFIWIALIYVIVAFTDVTAGTFVGKIEELEGTKVNFERGGAVAFSSTAYLLLAMVMGLVQKRFNPPLWLMTIVFVPATLFIVWLGTKCSTWLLISGAGGGLHPQKTWGVIILIYCLIASLLPVWLLLQPRGYLGGFVLYIVLAVGVIGILFGGFEVQQPAFKGWVQRDGQGNPTPTGLLFPFLFVTIACGACSGFHGLVCSGTTSKQIARESDCHAVGYGAMLLEAFVALIALATVMMVAKTTEGPGVIYAKGIGRFLTVILGPNAFLFAFIFGSLAFSTFVFDTLDVATRLSRYIVQELFNWHGRTASILSTIVTVSVPLFFILSADAPQSGKPPAYMAFWTLFGTSNQLLAGLTLLGITVWLKRIGKPYWFTLVPMVFVTGITIWSLAIQSIQAFRLKLGLNPATINGAVCLCLAGLTAFLVTESVKGLRRPAAPVAG